MGTVEVQTWFVYSKSLLECRLPPYYSFGCWSWSSHASIWNFAYVKLLSRKNECFVSSKNLLLSLDWQAFEQASASTLCIFLDSCSLSGTMWNQTRLWRRWMWCLHCYDIQVWSFSEENPVSFAIWTLQQRNKMKTDPGSWRSRCGTKKKLYNVCFCQNTFFTFGT